MEIHESLLKQGSFSGAIEGTADLSQEPIPLFDLNIRLEEYQALLQQLVSSGVIESRIGLFLGAGLTSFADESGVVNLPLNQRENTLYVGPLPVMKLPEPRAAATEDVRRENVTPPPEL